jgi:hypothetical protein
MTTGKAGCGAVQRRDFTLEIGPSGRFAPRGMRGE